MVDSLPGNDAGAMTPVQAIDRNCPCDTMPHCPSTVLTTLDRYLIIFVFDVQPWCDHERTSILKHAVLSDVENAEKLKAD
jgi:hypothetical protein